MLELVSPERGFFVAMEERIIRREIGDVEAQLPGAEIPDVVAYQRLLEETAALLRAEASPDNVAKASTTFTTYWFRELNRYLVESGANLGSTIEFSRVGMRKAGTTDLSVTAEEGMVSIARLSETTDDGVAIYRDENGTQHITVESIFVAGGEQVIHSISFKDKTLTRWDRNGETVYKASQK